MGVFGRTRVTASGTIPGGRGATAPSAPDRKILPMASPTGGKHPPVRIPSATANARFESAARMRPPDRSGTARFRAGEPPRSGRFASATVVRGAVDACRIRFPNRSAAMWFRPPERATRTRKAGNRAHARSSGPRTGQTRRTDSIHCPKWKNSIAALGHFRPGASLSSPVWGGVFRNGAKDSAIAAERVWQFCNTSEKFLFFFVSAVAIANSAGH